MDKNKRLAVWLPVIIALSVALGIFVGNHYLRLTQGKRHIYSSGNKINAILDIIDEQYVDTVNMKQLVEDAIPKVFSELDPHSVYIPAKDAQRVNEDLEGSFSGIGVSFNMQTDTILVINVIPGGPSEKGRPEALRPYHHDQRLPVCRQQKRPGSHHEDPARCEEQYGQAGCKT